VALPFSGAEAHHFIHFQRQHQPQRAHEPSQYEYLMAATRRSAA
jgi:hypothetical protein